MEFVLGVLALAVIIIFIIAKLLSNNDEGETKVSVNAMLPYIVTDNFLTEIERSFYHR